MIKPLMPSSLAPESADVVAARWVARRSQGALRAHEQAEFDAWLMSDPLHQAAFDRAAGAYETAGVFAPAPEILAMRREALAMNAQPSDRRPWIIAAAACLALLLFGAWRLSDELFVVPNPPMETAESSATPGAPRDHYATQVGERLTATLSDGSTLTLNTASEVRIRYSDAARRIELVRGQAFFTVAHRADWPFLVEAGGQSVRALGTQFEVRRDGRSLEVVLVEGRVAVGETRALSRGDLSRAVELQAGERLVAAPGAYEVAPVNAQAATSWRSGRVLFSATPLGEAVAEINRYRARPLVIEDPAVAALEISGAFRTADAQSFGEALATTVPVEERALPDGRTLLVHRSHADEDP